MNTNKSDKRNYMKGVVDVILTCGTCPCCVHVSVHYKGKQSIEIKSLPRDSIDDFIREAKSSAKQLGVTPDNVIVTRKDLN